MGKFTNDELAESLRIKSFDQRWGGTPEDPNNKCSGMQVEEFICRNLENLTNTSVENMTYDQSNSELKIIGKDGNILAQTTVTVVTPTYNYGIWIYGVRLNNQDVHEASETKLLTQYTKNTKVELGVALYASIITTKEQDRLGSYPISVSFGNKTGKYDINTIPREQCNIDDNSGKVNGVKGVPVDVVKWIDITELFTVAQEGTISASINFNTGGQENLNKTESYTLPLTITNEIIELKYEDSVLINNNTVTFSLSGNASNYYLQGYDGDEPINTSAQENTMEYSKLKSGINHLSIRAVNKINSNIKSDYIYVDIICTKDCNETIVAVNNVSEEIENNGVATLYKLTVFSPNKEELILTTYLEDSVSDEAFNPTNVVKQEFLNASVYDEHNVYTTDYKKYMEIESLGTDVDKQLAIKIKKGDVSNFYQFYYASDNFIIKTQYKSLTVQKSISELFYYQGVKPKFNFDQTTGYINNVFITKDYSKIIGLPVNIKDTLEVSDGWKEENGFVYFKVSASDTPLFKQNFNALLENNFTIELGLKTYNISNPDVPIMTIGDYEIRPTQSCWNNPDYFGRTNSQFQEDVKTHITIVVQSNFSLDKTNPYYPKYLGGSEQSTFDQKNMTMDVMRIYINGVIDREIKLEKFLQLNNLKKGISIKPSASDVNFYLFRIYNNKALTSEQVQQNYISFIDAKQEKLKFYNRNDILKPDGSISFAKSRNKVNSLVYVFPKGNKFPNRFWGGADGDANNKVNSKTPSTLFVNYSDPATNQLYGGRLTKGLVKGQGSSAMKYLIWNVAFQLNKYKTPEGKKIKSEFTPYSNLQPDNTFKPDSTIQSGFYLMPPYTSQTAEHGQQDKTPYEVTKLVGKVNFASSMQAHKPGACKLYDDAYKYVKDGTPLKLPSGGLKAVHEEPFLYFYVETDLPDVSNVDLKWVLEHDNDVKFMGFQTWGSAKKDKATYGYDDDLTPEYLLMEGGENGCPSVNFLRPWQALQRLQIDDIGSNPLADNPTVTKQQSIDTPDLNLYIKDESIVYMDAGSWDVDFGLDDSETAFTEKAKISLKKFREFYDFVYSHNYNFITVSEGKPTTNKWDISKIYAVTGTNHSEIDAPNHKAGDLYRYDEPSGKWVPAGLYYNKGVWESLSMFHCLKQDDSRLADIAKIRIKEEFTKGISKFVDEKDISYHQAFIKFILGTDNRAKNTYFQIIGQVYKDTGRVDEFEKPIFEPVSGDYKLRLLQDDLDSIIATDNNGLQTKPYNLLEDSYIPEYQKWWGDIGSAFFQMYDQCKEQSIQNELKKILNFAGLNPTNISGDKSYFYDVFFSIQEYFPAIAYNHTSTIYYENAQFIKDSGVSGVYGNNGVEPIEQVHGSCLECERSFMKKRIAFLAGYAQAAGAIGTLTETTGTNTEGTMTKYILKFIPYQDFYPTHHYGATDPIPTPISNEFQKSEYNSIKRLAKTGQPYSIQILNKGKVIYQGFYQLDLYKTLDITGLVQNLNVNFKHATDYTVDNNELKKHIELFGENYPKLDLSAFNTRFPVVENLSLKNVQLPNVLDTSAFYKLKVLDLTGSITKYVKFPDTGNLTTVILPASITKFTIYNNPELTEVKFASKDKLEEIFIDGSKCGKFDVAKFCEDLILNTKLTSVTLRNCNISITEEALLNLIKHETCNLDGSNIKVVDELGQKKAINFSTLQMLVNKFGLISGPDAKVQIDYMTKSFTGRDIECVKEFSIFREPSDPIGDIVRNNPFQINIINGNDVKIEKGPNPNNPNVNGYLNITYSLNCSADIAEIDKFSGKITLHKEDYQQTVEASIHILSITNGIQTVTSKINFYWKSPQLGDLAYADGSFSSVYNPAKTLIGVVFAKTETTREKGKVYVVGNEYVQKEEGEYIGYQNAIVRNEGSSSTTNDELNAVKAITEYLTAPSHNVENYDSVVGASTSKLFDGIKYSPSGDGYSDKTDMYFTGKTNTDNFIKHVNTKLFTRNFQGFEAIKALNVLKYDSQSDTYSIPDMDAFRLIYDKLVLINTDQDLNGRDDMGCLLFHISTQLTYINQQLRKVRNLMINMYKVNGMSHQLENYLD